jgi:hypothetical protein
LIVEFKINPEWTKEKVEDLSERTGLSESQVYKWNWDQRKKFVMDFDNIDAEVARDEFGDYCCKKWGKNDDFDADDNICKLLGLDVEKMALELVKVDLEKRQKTGATSSKAKTITPVLIRKKESLALTQPAPFKTPTETLLRTPIKDSSTRVKQGLIVV